MIDSHAHRAQKYHFPLLAGGWAMSLGPAPSRCGWAGDVTSCDVIGGPGGAAGEGKSLYMVENGVT